MVKGGYTPRIFKPNGGIGKTFPRNTLQRAPACFKFSTEALARVPQPMPCTRFFFFFCRARCWGERHCRVGGVKRIPPFDNMLGGYAQATLLNVVYHPCINIISPQLTEMVPLHDH